MRSAFCLCVLCALRRRGIPNLQARSPDGGHICLCVLVVRYTYDSSVQALDSRTARRTTRAVNGPKSQHAAGSKFAFESHMSGSHLACQECGLLVSYRPLAPGAGRMLDGSP